MWSYSTFNRLVVHCFLLTLTTVAGVKHLVSSFSMCVILCVILSDCPHDKTKTAEVKITKLATGIVHHESLPVSNIRSKVKVTESKGDRVAGVSYALYRGSS